MEEKISVIIPCYNVEKYIDRCLASVARQTIGIEKLEIICVNDASTDGTWQKLSAWERKYPQNILLVDCAQNGKLGRAILDLRMPPGIMWRSWTRMTGWSRIPMRSFTG